MPQVVKCPAIFKRKNQIRSITTTNIYKVLAPLIGSTIFRVIDCGYLLVFTLSIYGSLFTKRRDILPKDRMNRVWTFLIALKFDRILGSSAAGMSVKFQSNAIIITSISRLQDFMRSCSKTSVRLVNSHRPE